MGRIRRKAESHLGWDREVNRGSWSAAEDQVLTDYIQIHGQGHWEKISKLTGLKRSGKSCRLRWLNYLRPDIKRGNISHDEEDLIIRLHNLLGNRWSLIAGRLPGRTDNEIKNYWNSTLRKKLQIQSVEKRISSETDDIIGSSSWDELMMFDINSVSHDINLSSILHQDDHLDLQAL